MRKSVRSVWIAIALLSAAAGCDGAGGGGNDAPLEGRWVGRLESNALPSGSSRMVLELERARAGEAIAARAVFGEGAAPAPPTDPEVGWPMGVDPLLRGIVPVADGFGYEAIGGRRDGVQVRIDFAVTELWRPWCAIQTPYPIVAGDDEHQCLPNRAWTATPLGCRLDADEMAPETPVDCLKLTLCRRTRVCRCTAAGCVPSPTGLTMYVELTFADDTASGALVWLGEGGAAGAVGVRLTRE